jgi:hypothetical protein
MGACHCRGHRCRAKGREHGVGRDSFTDAPRARIGASRIEVDPLDGRRTATPSCIGTCRRVPWISNSARAGFIDNGHAVRRNVADAFAMRHFTTTPSIRGRLPSKPHARRGRLTRTTLSLTGSPPGALRSSAMFQRSLQRGCRALCPSPAAGHPVPNDIRPARTISLRTSRNTLARRTPNASEIRSGVCEVRFAFLGTRPIRTELGSAKREPLQARVSVRRQPARASQPPPVPPRLVRRPLEAGRRRRWCPRRR